MAPNLDWLLVGTGDIVRKRVAGALATTPGSRIVGVVGGIERAKAIAGEHGAKAYASLDEALRDTAAPAAYVATPVYRHRDEALKCLAAGKHVLIEKPLGLNVDDASSIAAAAKAAAKGIVAGCAYYRRCYPRFTLAKQLLDSGTLGKLVLIRMSYHGWFNPTRDDPKFWRVVKANSGGGPLADMACHMIDVLIGLAGMPTKVFAHAETLVHGYEVEDSSAVTMTLAGGAHVIASFGWNTKTFLHDMEIVGSEGKLAWLPYDTGKVVQTIGRDVKELDLPNAANVHGPLVADFMNAVGSGGTPVSPLGEALKTNQVLDAIYSSAASGREVTL